jgi:hypothetical protein
MRTSDDMPTAGGMSYLFTQFVLVGEMGELAVEHVVAVLSAKVVAGVDSVEELAVEDVVLSPRVVQQWRCENLQ